MSSSSGTKVTNDPQATEKVEGVGQVTSDSLAGDSLQSGGSFGSGSNAAASKQPSSSTTANNTDISGATTLQAAPDAEARQASEQWSESSQLNAGKGLGKEGGVASTYATSGASGGQSYSSAAGGSSSGGSANAGSAPNYVNTPANSTGGSAKPHGANVSEGGFDSNAPNSSFDADIGGKNDPGRAALQGLQNRDASAGGDIGPKQSGVSNDNQYSSLGDTDA